MLKVFWIKADLEDSDQVDKIDFKMSKLLSNKTNQSWNLTAENFRISARVNNVVASIIYILF